MRLTTYSDYALRVLMYLALKPDGLSTIAGIAESYDISEAHLMKVVHQLGVAGYIETVRGRGGGLRLAKPVEAPCAIFPSCVLKRALGQARDAFLAVLEEYTLADLVAPRAALSGLLGITSQRGAQH
jgi:Rrf2 family nitric oxide-sensitive transcriptional repressor